MNLINRTAASTLIAAAMIAGPGIAQAGAATGPPGQAVPGVHQVDSPEKQAAFEHMLNELNLGWANGGAAGTAIGSVAGLGIGCISMFPGSLAGCIIGAPTGAIIGALAGMATGNPNAQQAIQDYINTP